MEAVQYHWKLKLRNNDNSGRLNAWLSELYGKAGMVDVPLDEYLERFVPCHISEPLHFEIMNPFKML